MSTPGSTLTFPVDNGWTLVGEIKEFEMGNVLVVDDERSIRSDRQSLPGGRRPSRGSRRRTWNRPRPFSGSKPVDVILADVVLPRVSGLDLLRRIHDMSPRVQVIMMTGRPTLESAAESLRYGAVDYLQKPIEKNEILKAVRNAVRVKHLNDQKLALEEENKKHMNHLEQLVESRTHALAMSEAALRQRAEELSILHRLARKMNESRTVEGSIKCGLCEISKAVAPDHAVFFVRSEEELVCKGIFPDQPGTAWQPKRVHTIGACLCGLAAAEGRAVYSADLRRDSAVYPGENAEMRGLSSFAALPLRVGSGIIGRTGDRVLSAAGFSGACAPFSKPLLKKWASGLNKNLLHERVQQNAIELKQSLARIEKSETERLGASAGTCKGPKGWRPWGPSPAASPTTSTISWAVVTGCTELVLRQTPRDSRSWKKPPEVSFRLPACKRPHKAGPGLQPAE